MTNVLNAGKVELVDSMGSDLAVVQAARISNGAVLPDWRDVKDEKLINYLAQHGHMTPFEHVVFKFYVKAPIFVIREWQRHRSFSYNEMSARYKELQPEFFVPEHPRVSHAGNKQSSVETDDFGKSFIMKMATNDAYQQAWMAYQDMLNAGIARELARIVLPVGIYSEMYVTGNLRNWFHWWQLRSSEDAQQEIRDYAHAVGEIIMEKVPISFNALFHAGENH